MFTGTIYGVALNDREALRRLAAAFGAAPYEAPPVAPVVYLRPRRCASSGGAPIPLPPDVPGLTVAATLGLVFARDATRETPATALAAVGAVAVCLDVAVPGADYHRPALRAQARDGFLPHGALAAPPAALAAVEFTTRLDGAVAHRWSLARLARPVATLVADLTAFMTLAAGDVLLVGLADDAPVAAAGQRVEVLATGLPGLATRVEPGGAP
jgi:5-oxopent-3-ene-1,2,5-tricarboxylate decarboxylase/2-hydroxyhepta-2,4-diene-1,7-dioate isomerase